MKSLTRKLLGQLLSNCQAALPEEGLHGYQEAYRFDGYLHGIFNALDDLRRVDPASRTSIMDLKRDGAPISLLVIEYKYIEYMDPESFRLDLEAIIRGTESLLEGAD